MPALFEWIARSAAVPGLVLPALYASYGLARWLVPGAGLALRGTATAAIGIWIGTVGFHLLSAMHRFSLPAGLALMVSAARAVHFGLRGSGGIVAPLRADVAKAWDRVRPRRGRPWASAASVAIILAAGGFAARAASVPVLSRITQGMITVGVGDNTCAGGQNSTAFKLAGFLPEASLSVDNHELVHRGQIRTQSRRPWRIYPLWPY